MMRVALRSVEFSDDARRAVRARFGKSGLATRAECRSLYRSLADADMEVIVEEWRKDQEERAMAKGGGA